ncbi:MAG: DUF475 domain-containing protein [Bdellovibrionales bacterium]|nr:DUF475 domain-containing protein [Bdellovibrionales bacterium]
MKDSLKYYYSSFFVTLIGLIIGFWIGYAYSGTWAGAFSALFLTSVLAVLEISLSFDNAVVNASVLREMTPKWRHRFITWGIAIAVFGMRIVFPLVVVSLAAKINPWSAVVLAATEPAEYARIMLGAHLGLAGFGGAFLMMVALNFFFDAEKTHHWLGPIERVFSQLGRIKAVEMGLCLLFFYLLTQFLDDHVKKMTFLSSGMFGVITYVFVDGISAFLKLPDSGRQNIEKASAAMFVYLEVLDASFSFDGVIGAFALTSNLFIIAAGLGIGAMFVRSMTIHLVEKQTLNQFAYLEHGAFYAIGALALFMILDVFMHVPEAVTGLVGAVIIGISLYSSIHEARKQRAH